MRVIVSDQAGFCFGVRRAIDLAGKAVEQGGPVTTLGPLIHNPQEVERLKAAGVSVAASVDEAAGGRAVMPSHGVTEETLQAAMDACSEVIDATCPNVARVQKCAKELAASGLQVVVVGDPGHSEVKGILSAAGPGAIAVGSVEEAKARKWKGRFGIVAQTTETQETFQRIVKLIRKTADDVRAVDTICIATRKRQEAASALAPEVDVIIVIGGRNSANTRRLRELCEATGVPTHHVETADEILDEWLAGKTTAGVAAGASTPDRLITEVKDQLEKA